LTHLTAYSLTDLTGLAAMTNLTSLRLTGNAYSNLAALKNLNQLTTLTLLDIGGGSFPDLAGLTNLTDLFLDGDSITNVGFLQNLVGLKNLSLGNNRIVDLTPLSGLTNLQVLYLQGNLLAEILPIKNLPRLSYVNVQLNLLDTAANSAAMAVTQSWRDRGVFVDDQPQWQPPEIFSPGYWTINVKATSAMLFAALDSADSSNPLLISAHSSNTALVPDDKIDINQLFNAFFNNLWTLTVTPTANLTGTTTITVSATNLIGISTNFPILVTVAAPLPFDGHVLNDSNLTWQTGVNAPWFGQSLVTHDGRSAAQSGSILGGDVSWLETTFPGPGTLSFWWKVSSQTNWDTLGYYINGVLQPAVISGEESWQQKTVRLPPGPQTVRWQYAKDPAIFAGADAAWLDEVAFTPSSWLELTARPAGNQCQLLLHPVMGKVYEVLASTNLTTWFSLGVITPTNSTMPFLHTNANASACFYRLHELSAPAIFFEPPKLVGNSIQLVLHSPVGARIEMQTSTNLTSWSALAVITNSLGTIQYTNPLPANSPKSFFRARQLP
jgi:hypothetical protein